MLTMADAVLMCDGDMGYRIVTRQTLPRSNPTIRNARGRSPALADIEMIGKMPSIIPIREQTAKRGRRGFGTRRS